MNTIINDIDYDAACMVVTKQEASVTSLMRLLNVNGFLSLCFDSSYL